MIVFFFQPLWSALRGWFSRRQKEDPLERALYERIERLYYNKYILGSVLPPISDTKVILGGFILVIICGFLFGTGNIVQTVVFALWIVSLIILTLFYVFAHDRAVWWNDAREAAKEIAGKKKSFTAEEENIVGALLRLEGKADEKPFLPPLIKAALNTPHLSKTKFFKRLEREYRNPFNRI